MHNGYVFMVEPLLVDHLVTMISYSNAIFSQRLGNSILVGYNMHTVLRIVSSPGNLCVKKGQSEQKLR